MRGQFAGAHTRYQHEDVTANILLTLSLPDQGYNQSERRMLTHVRDISVHLSRVQFDQLQL